MAQVHYQRLTAEERAQLADACRRLGAARVARELGVANGVVASLLTDRAQRGTYALVRPAMSRLFGELAAHDASTT